MKLRMDIQGFDIMAARRDKELSHYFFIFLLMAGAFLVVASFLLPQPERLFGGLRQLAAGLLLIGTGEWINHPLQKTLTYHEHQEQPFHRKQHRRRNPSALGNVLEICGVVLLFTGLADYL